MTDATQYSLTCMKTKGWTIFLVWHEGRAIFHFAALANNLRDVGPLNGRQTPDNSPIPTSGAISVHDAIRLALHHGEPITVAEARERYLDRLDPPGMWQALFGADPQAGGFARDCEACGKGFTSRQATGRYCSNACRSKAMRGRRATRQP